MHLKRDILHKGGAMMLSLHMYFFQKCVKLIQKSSTECKIREILAN